MLAGGYASSYNSSATFVVPQCCFFCVSNVAHCGVLTVCNSLIKVVVEAVVEQKQLKSSCLTTRGGGFSLKVFGNFHRTDRASKGDLMGFVGPCAIKCHTSSCGFSFPSPSFPSQTVAVDATFYATGNMTATERPGPRGKRFGNWMLR